MSEIAKASTSRLFNKNKNVTDEMRQKYSNPPAIPPTAAEQSAAFNSQTNKFFNNENKPAPSTAEQNWNKEVEQVNQELNSTYDTDFGKMSGYALRALKNEELNKYAPEPWEADSFNKAKNYYNNQKISIPINSNRNLNMSYQTKNTIDRVFKYYGQRIYLL
jgi:hypothetical protein